MPVSPEMNSVFMTEEERKAQVKQYRLAWYPAKEPEYKHIQYLEGTSSSLVGGQMYIIGGLEGRANGLFHLYDPSTDRFSPFSVTGLHPRTLAFHTSVGINNSILIFGGESSVGVANSSMVTNEIFVLDTETREIKKIKTLKYVEPRKHHSACALGPFMIISGGISEDGGKPIQDIDSFSTQSNEWQKVQHRTDWSGLWGHTMTAVFEGSVKTLYSKVSGKNRHVMESSELLAEGLYVFGGVKATGRATNQLLIINPCKLG